MCFLGVWNENLLPRNKEVLQLDRWNDLTSVVTLWTVSSQIVYASIFYVIDEAVYKDLEITNFNHGDSKPNVYAVYTGVYNKFSGQSCKMVL